jgi:lipoprotein-releasing system permease protein
MRRMTESVELLIGLRYLLSKKRSGFVSFISAISLLGVALGVAALITILSVMNGFESELRERLLSMSAHGAVSARHGQLRDWESIQLATASANGVEAAAPYVEIEGMIRAGSALQSVIVNGIDPVREREISRSYLALIAGDMDSLVAGENNIIPGRALAMRLGVIPGDDVVLLVPRPSVRGDLQPVLQRFVVSGVFEAGLQDHDANLAIVHWSDASRLLGSPGDVTGIRFRAADVFAAPRISAALQQSLGDTVKTTDWTIENASYFRAIKLEKMMMSIILTLIIAVAAFNIIASLVMVVTEKTTDIAILRTLGLAPGNVVKVFFIQGIVIGWIGVFIGVCLGIVLALNVPVVVPVLESALGFQIMPGDVYYVSQIPSELHAGNVVIIAVTAFVLTALATLYPARRAAHVNPAIALRYE